MIKVSVIGNKPLYNAQEQVFLSEQGNGDYWLLATEEEKEEVYWLLPKGNFKVNTFNLKTVQSLFNCQRYQPKDSTEFTLSKPARVSLIPNRQEWKLKEQGILDFDQNSLSSKLQLELEKAKQELEELRQERSHLVDKVAELAYERLQETRSQLVTADEFKKQMQQVLLKCEQLQSQVTQLTQQQEHFKSQLQQVQQKTTPTKEEMIDALEHQQHIELAPSQGNIKASSIKTPTTQFQLSHTPNYSNLATPQLVQAYNQNPRSLLIKATEVSETDESIRNRRLGSQKHVVLEKNRRGKFWILKDGDFDYLVLRINFNINEYNDELVQTLFECRGYRPDLSRYFTLLKPARVSPLTPGQKWQLEEPGILEFK
ncbi:MAG: hypothetical protein F6K58_11295 [Symploca sp. SIO2E9]|nr:hypothetical protein [Symploca sp. SIO2E9]